MATVSETVIHRRTTLVDETPPDNVAPESTREESVAKKKSRRPPKNRWLQQQIPACRPVFTAKYVFVLFMAVGVVFLILGILFTAVAADLRELEVEYTDCEPVDENITQTGCESYLRSISGLSNDIRNVTEDCHCEITFEVEKDIRYPWKFYYALDNYYQNHRRYLNSWDPAQLRGDNFDDPAQSCRPLRESEQGGNESRQSVAPCGLIANSFFNDSFQEFVNNDLNETVQLDSSDISWRTDREVRFRNPDNFNFFRDRSRFNRPPNWPRWIDGGLENESLIVWFRVSAFPWFRKLYAHPREDEDLPAGNYSLSITYNYPVGNFDGRKFIFISELSWLGGRNLFLGVAYIITAIVCIITAIVLLIIHLFFSKWKTTDPNFLKRKY